MLDLGPEGQEFMPWPVFLGKTLNSQCLSPPRCINGNQQIALGITRQNAGLSRGVEILLATACIQYYRNKR